MHWRVRLIGVLVLASVLLTTSCTPASGQKVRFNAEFVGKIEQFDAVHAASLELGPEQDIAQCEYALAAKEVGFTEQELRELTAYKTSASPSATTILTLKQASTDVDVLFRVFKYCYGPYQYFGGDARFGKAKAGILADLNSEGTVSTLEFLDLLVKDLSFIQDTHFSIDTRHFVTSLYYLHSEEIAFEKDESGFFKTQDGERLHVDSVSGKDPADFMKLSIDPEGKLVYYVGGLYPAIDFRNRAPEVQVGYRGNETSDTVTLHWSSDSSLSDDPAYRKQVIDGIPVVSLRRCYDKDTDDTTCEDFAASGSAMRDRKVFVLDIRGNRGGDDDYVLQWVRNYTGNANLKQLTTGSEIDQLDSKAGGYLFAKTLQNLPKMSEMAQRIATSSMEIYQDGANTWSLTRFSPAKQTENPNVIFVLVDKGVASSGEEIIPELETMKNVVIVGTNSSGCMLSNAEVQIVLPNSKLSVQCGNWLNLYNSKFFAEGTGFLPDIWDAGDDALSRLVAMIKYYRAR